MDKKQTIKCTVGSCEYNNKLAQKCERNRNSCNTM